MNVFSILKRMQKSKSFVLLELLLILGLITAVIFNVLLLLGPVVGNVFSDIPSPGRSWQAEFWAWLDENENGVWDTNEVPLQDVRFSVTYQTETDHARSDWKGYAFLQSIFSECPNTTFEVYAEPPDGYRLTTTDRFNAGSGCDGDEGPHLFGFTYLAGAPTVTPFPAEPNCISHKSAYINDITIAPDNTLWFATRGDGAAHYDPDEETWTSYKNTWIANSGLASNHITSIAVSEDNVVWLGTDLGLTRFDGSSWTSYTTKDGLANNHITNVAIASDGTVWCTTDEGSVSHFVPSTNRWVTYSTEGEYRSNVVTNIVTDSDGVLWLGTISWGIYQIIPITNTAKGSTSTAYKIGPYQKPSDGALIIDDMTLVKDKFWLVGDIYQDYHGYFGYFDLGTEQWEIIGDDDDFMAVALALAPDGSFWIGSRENSIRRFTPTENGQGEGYWTLYNFQNELLRDSISKMVFAPDGTLWVGTPSGIAQCTLREE